MVLADQAAPGVDINRVIRMLLIHDLVEIDVGDVPIHSANGQAHASAETQAAEQRAADRIFGLLPAGQGAEFPNLTTTQFEAFIKKELTKWAQVVKASGAKLD